MKTIILDTADMALVEVISAAVEVGANPIEANSPLNWVHANISWIEHEMRLLQSQLKRLEAKQAKTPEVIRLLDDIRDLALDSSDILDTYLSESEAHKRKGCSRFAERAACIPCYGTSTAYDTNALQPGQLKNRIRALQLRIDSVLGDQANEDVETEPDQRSLLVVDSPFVGREESLEKLKAELLSVNSECKLISVVGVQGIGKTSLVKKICHELRDKFEFSTLVHVSDKPSARDLLLEIARKAVLGEDKMDENLEINLQSLLQQKKCLIHLDDIRRAETWDALKRALPTSSRNCSRIIITCRYTDVGRYIASDERCLIKLNPLNHHDSWELVLSRMKHFSEDTNGTLEAIGWDIDQRCHGFPLAIVSAVDTLMKTSRDERAWKQVLEDWSYESYITNIWCLSYKELPVELRHLFLHFGLYPVDTKISVSELTRALLAGKSIQSEGNKDPEDIVEDKLKMLIDFNLIEVSTRRLNGRIRSCRMNHFQHSICIHKARQNCLFAINDIYMGIFSSIRRLTIDGDTFHQEFRYLNATDARLHTLLVFAKDGRRSYLSGEISNLSRLVFLKLTGDFNGLPPLLNRLKKLETLDFEKASFSNADLQIILKMESIKHLLLSRDIFSECCSVRKEVNLPNVETLGWITGEILKTSSIQNLSNLRKLKLFDAAAHHIEELSILQKLEQLWLNADPQQCTKLNMSGYRHLVRLHLSYDWSYDIKLEHIEFPPNLVELILKGIKFEADPMSVLKKLPKLEFLKLKHCLYLLILNCCGPDSFLELLELEITSSFSKLIVDDTGMPKLGKFVYGGDAQPNIPDRLRQIMTIRPIDKTGKTKEPIAWTDENEQAFLETLFLFVRSRKLHRPTFTEDEWEKINQGLLFTPKFAYGVDRLKGKWNHLCMVHRLFSQLLRHSGVTWDSISNHVNAPEEVWQQFYKINKTEYKKFRNEGCKYYELLTEMLGKTTSTGGLEKASACQSDDGISNKCQNEEPKISKTELDTCIEQLFEKSSKQIVDDGEATSQDPYSDIVCFSILNKMEGVSHNVYMKAINALKDPHFRKSFVMMPEIRRGPILEFL